VSSKSFNLCSLICLQPCELIELNSNGRYSPIDILNHDVLLNIFDLYRLADGYDDRVLTVLVYRQRWWYKLAHVCRLWRNIILESPSRLDLHLYCTNGVPVADMLAHSPPLPLTIRYRTDRVMTATDESGILLALSHRDRVHHIDFWKLPNVEKFVTVMDDQFPILERVYIESLTEVVIPVTFQAPNLLYLILKTASLPIGSSLLTTTAAGLVTLSLLHIPPHFPPVYILTRLSLMLRLELLVIGFQPPFPSPLPNRDVDRQLHQTPDMTPLPNLRLVVFKGMATYLEGLVARISAPALNQLHIYLDSQPSSTFPHLLQFMQTSKNLRFTALQVNFGELAVSLHTVPWKWDTPLTLKIRCGHLDSQLATAAQLFGTLSPVLSAVEQVTFSCDKIHHSTESYNNFDRRQWGELVRPFTGAKTIHVQDDLVSKIFRSLPSDDGEPPLELLPKLEVVGYSGESDSRDAFTTFLNERQVASHPVTLRIVDCSVFEDR
jgi:hypothetical protein